MKLEFLNKTLLLESGKEKILVVADLHIGYEEALNKAGVLVPRIQFKETLADLKEIFKHFKKKEKKIDEIIVLGDLKHEFGEISRQEWIEVKEILDFFKKKTKKTGKVVLIKGNHDTVLGPIAKRKELEIKDFYIIGEKEKICFLHGHKLFPECLDKKIKMIIMGHRHPAVVLHDKYKKEKYKCFFVGKWKGKKIIILPSFFPFVEGSDVVNLVDNKLFIPEKSLRNFDVYVLGEKNKKKIYKFGKLKSLL